MAPRLNMGAETCNFLKLLKSHDFGSGGSLVLSGIAGWITISYDHDEAYSLIVCVIAHVVR